MSVDQLDPVAWLSQADPTPEHAYRWWVRHPHEIAMIPTGIIFDAVKVGAALGVTLRRALTEIDAPCFTDVDNGTTYFLVPTGTAATWPPGRDALCLGIGTWLWVPVPTRTRRSHSYWESAPDGSGALYDPHVLLDALTVARGAA